MIKDTKTNKKLKIAFVLDDGFDSIDGVQRNLLTLGKWLTDDGHSVKYISGETKRRDIPGLIPMSKNLRVRFNGNVLSISLLSSKREIISVLKKEKFDVIHVQVPYSPFMGARVVKYAYKNSLVVGTFHILPYRKSVQVGNYLLGFWLRNNLKKFDLQFSVSKPTAQFAKKTHNIDSQIIANPVEMEAFIPSGQTQFKKFEPHIVFLGRLVPRKGCMELLRAIKLLDVRENVRVHICGDGNQRRELEKFVEDNDLTEKVTFHGFVTEKQKIRFLQAADIAVFPAMSGEAFGIVLIEAMAAKSHVVIAGNNPGYKSVLGSIQESLFNPKKPEQIAALISKVISSKKFADSVHQKQQNLVKDFDIEIIGPKLLEKYKDGLARKF